MPNETVTPADVAGLVKRLRARCSYSEHRMNTVAAALAKAEGRAA